MNDIPAGDKGSAHFALGCGPQIKVEVVENFDGTLFFKLAPARFDGTEPDIDGFFLSLTDDSQIDAIRFFPVLNNQNVTGQQAMANGVDTLANGAIVDSPFDLGLQFGTLDDSTQGDIKTINFTLRSENGPLKLANIDLQSMSAVVNSDDPDGLVLTVDGADDDGGGSDGDPVELTTVLQSEDFKTIHDPDDSTEIDRDGGWEVKNGQLCTDSCNDGTLKFAEVATDDPVTLRFEIKAGNLGNFESGGRCGDSLKLQVQVDGGDWVTLDEFTVNHDKSAMVGSETGNTFGETSTTLNYSGGVLDTAGDSVQFRFHSDISARDEQIFIENFKVSETTMVDGGPPDGGSDGGDPDKIDFEALNQGDSVSDQFDGVQVSAQRSGNSDSSQNDAMIFDTDNPTGDDHDLGFDGLGNALIISEDNDAEHPDDNAHGGTISFAFEAPSKIVSLIFLDIEEAGGTVDLYDEAGDLITTIGIPVSGDNKQDLLNIDTDGVSVMDVNLIGSGAIDDLCYIPPVADKVCDAQYPVDYATGLPMIPIDEEPLDEEATEDTLPPVEIA